ncbi:MAG: hypothetical protein ACPHID_07870 [Thermoplasmatota archaeon]
MDTVRAGQFAAATMAVAAVSAAFWHVGAAIVAGGASLALALLTTKSAAVQAQSQDFSQMLSDLRLRGPGHHVPTDDGVRLFIPADPRGPYLVPDVRSGAVQRDPPASIGLAMDAPCAGLLSAWLVQHGWPQGKGPEEATQHVQAAMRRLELADHVRVAQHDDAFRIEMRLHDPDPARKAQDTGWHLQGGCTASSLACALMALALGRPIRTEASRVEADGTLILEVVAGTTV